MTENHYEEITLDPGSPELPTVDLQRDCPACSAPNSSDRGDCEACGIVFAKMREPRPASMRGMGDARTRQSTNWGAFMGRIMPLLVLAGIGFAVWFFVLRAGYVTVGPAIGEGEMTVVLLHDFGTPADAMVPRAKALSARLPQITWVMPAGPHGARTGSAWVVGPQEAELRATAAQSAQAIRGLLAELTEAGVDPGAVYLGGYAQGAQVALDLALAPDAPELAGLILINGGIPNWPDARTLKNNALVEGTRVFLAHGQNDPIVPIAQAARMRAQLLEARIPLEFYTVAGGHGIAPGALDALADGLDGAPAR
ncbi:MAG: phospholipase/carboxylesterase [Bradymonadia bacterium]|jgi:phospholipase/carboxylesterase